MRNITTKRIRIITLLLLLALLVPIFVKSSYLLHLLVLMGVWIILADSNNFVTGFAGQLAIGHAAFVAIGGYAGALLMVDLGWNFWAALAVGGLTAFLSGLILGLMSMRLRGDYLGMVTLGFGEIIRLLAMNLDKITRGPAGIAGISRPSIFGYAFKGEVPYFYLIILLIIFTHMTIERLLFSRFGRACLAIREDEDAAKAMGVESYRYKVLSFCISSGYAGLVGVFYAAWATLLSPDSFTLTDSIMISAMITLGGIGSLLGPIPGAIGIGILPELLRPFTTGPRIASLRLAGVGLLLVVFLIVRPQGICGVSITKDYISLESIGRWFRKRKEVDLEVIHD
jgi:branched-chain amino acid transport system permease protein